MRVDTLEDTETTEIIETELQLYQRLLARNKIDGGALLTLKYTLIKS